MTTGRKGDLVVNITWDLPENRFAAQERQL